MGTKHCLIDIMKKIIMQYLQYIQGLQKRNQILRRSKRQLTKWWGDKMYRSYAYIIFNKPAPSQKKFKNSSHSALHEMQYYYYD